MFFFDARCTYLLGNSGWPSEKMKVTVLEDSLHLWTVSRYQKYCQMGVDELLTLSEHKVLNDFVISAGGVWGER